MDKTTQNLFVQFVKCALNGQPINSNAEALLPQTAEEIFNISKMHSVLPMVSFSLFKEKLLPKDDSITDKFRNAQIKEIYRHERMSYDLQQVCDLFERFEIDHIPLKGAVIRKFYPEPWMRTSCDIDILVKSQAVDKAVEVLCNDLNFTYKGKSFHDVSLMSANGTHIELHFTLINDDCIPKASEKLNKVWDTAENVNGFSHKFALSNEMFLLYHIVHMAKHFISGGCGIRAFVDLKLITENMKSDKNKLNDVLNEIGLLRFYNACSSLSEVWFKESIHNSVTNAMEQYILRGGVYGSSENFMAVHNNRGKSRVSLIFKVVFLPRKNLELIYPNLAKHPILLPFYQIKRWFRVFNKSKRKRATNIVFNSKTPQAETLQSVDSLFSELNLKQIK